MEVEVNKIKRRITLALLSVSIMIVLSAIYVSHARIAQKEQDKTRDKVMDYIVENYPELANVQPSNIWTKELVTEQSTILYKELTVIYKADGWTITVKTPNTITPIHEICVKYKGESSLIWNGTVHLISGDVMEKKITAESEPEIKAEQAPI